MMGLEVGEVDDDEGDGGNDDEDAGDEEEDAQAGEGIAGGVDLEEMRWEERRGMRGGKSEGRGRRRRGRTRRSVPMIQRRFSSEPTM